MLERLLENWLDSVNERGYQPAFCQMLVYEGHRIIHNTRHSPIEFGKDIITINKKGVPCAFQLKGNPGGRLTLTQFRKEVEPQLMELAYGSLCAIVGEDKPSHRCYLVTNGEIEEEVQRLINDLNNEIKKNIGKERRIQLLRRGDLLSKAIKMEANLWPAKPKELRLLLEIMSTQGQENFPYEKLDIILKPLLLLDKNSKKAPNKEFKRTIASTSLLISSCLWPFANENNHFASITAWIIFSGYILASCERFKYNVNTIAKASLDIAKSTIYFALEKLINELLVELPILTRNKGLSDFMLYWHRYFLLAALASIYLMWDNKPNPSNLTIEQEKQLEDFILSTIEHFSLEAEGQIPIFLIICFFLVKRKKQKAANTLLSVLTTEVIDRKTNSDPQSLIDPYHDIGDAIKHNLSKTIDSCESPISDWYFNNSSYFSKTLMELLAMANKKSQCITLWNQYSQILFRQFVPDQPWNYYMYRIEDGSNIIESPEETEHWNSLKLKAKTISLDAYPPSLMADNCMLMIFLLIFPYRANSDVVKHLYNQLNK